MFDSTYDWRDEMLALAKNDPWRKECLRICREREAAFFAVFSKLSPAEQEAVELYIAACEELTYSLIYHAYAVGKASGEFKDSK